MSSRLQLTVLLAAPGRDFLGGEFVLTEQRPRMQSRAAVVPLGQGDGVIFPVRERPVEGKSRIYRVNLRHGVSRVHCGPAAHARHHLSRRAMSTIPGSATGDLLSGQPPPGASIEPLAEGAVVLGGFARSAAAELVAVVAEVAARAPFRHMLTPRGYSMSAAMTNCGSAGWVTDRRGYRYDALDPESGRPWPPMAPPLRRLASAPPPRPAMKALHPTPA